MKAVFARRAGSAVMALVASLAVLGTLGGLVWSSASHADDPVFAITQAPDLRWGFKESFRNYAFRPATSGGATVVDTPGETVDYNLDWAFDSGTFDPESGTTVVKYRGSVRWTKYRASEVGFRAPPGWTGDPDPFILDLTLRDPEVTISAEGSFVTAELVSRRMADWELVDYGRVAVVNLDPAGVTPEVTETAVTWSGLPAHLAAEARDGFENYAAGTAVDPVGFSYSGPGGAPDLSEDFDEQGALRQELVENVMYVDEQEVWSNSLAWFDRPSMTLHFYSCPLAGCPQVEGVAGRRIVAFDLEQMRQVGAPWLVKDNESPSGRVRVQDTSGNWIYYRGTVAGETGWARRVTYDDQAGEYRSEMTTDPQLRANAFVGNNVWWAWDPTREMAWRIQHANGSTLWELVTLKQGDDGIWVKTALEIPNIFGNDQTAMVTSSSESYPQWATASDGSLIVAGGGWSTLPPTAQVPRGYRLTLDEEATSVDIEPLPAVRQNDEGDSAVEAVRTFPGGHVLLNGTSYQDPIFHCVVRGTVTCDDPVKASDAPATLSSYDKYAVDPQDGTLYLVHGGQQRIWAFRDGKSLGSQYFAELSQRGGPAVIGDDGSLYVQTSNSPASSGGHLSWGIGKLRRVGVTPTVVSSPEAVGVALGVGESSKRVAFTSEATGNPAPVRQWQQKAPGSARFVDIEGADDATLSIDARRGMDGAEYRAIYENAAGRIVTDPATLTVSYAPQLAIDAIDASVTEGANAVFQVLPGGNPEPAVSWQRRVGGFWQSIDPDDENFAIDGPSMTVLDTNVDQSGSLFRAKLANSVGTVYSRAARLTVNPRVSIPDGGVELENVSLDWEGSAELQKAPPFGGSNYLSAGVSDGTEATYSAGSGNVRVLQVSSLGIEAPATYLTRASHVAGAGKQLVRLYGGDARIDADGSATVEWDGSFSVNFYGGMVPFTLTDPELELDENGVGTLKADLAGYASSIENPDERSPLPPVADVVVATFSGVEIDPAGKISIAPDYAGVEVTVPDGVTAQNRTAAGWGAWPQPFVNFHVQTGLSSYWYSSGGAADPYKPPAPFLVDFDGPVPPTDPPAADQRPPGDLGPRPPLPVAQPKPAAKRATIAPAKTAQPVDGKGLVRFATLTCPRGGSCKVVVPRRVIVKIGGKRYVLAVLAPKTVKDGKRAVLRGRLPKAAVARLKGRRAIVKLEIAITTRDKQTRRKVTVTIKTKQRRRIPGTPRSYD